MESSLKPRPQIAESDRAVAVDPRFVYRITIPEGLTSEQIVSCLTADMKSTDERIQGLTQDQSYRCRESASALVGPAPAVPPEGFLLPDTYAFSRGDTRLNILNLMMRERDRVLSEVWARRAPDLPLENIEELAILASIVEKETSLEEERTRIAAVFLNRLRLNMPLQSDPTFIYGIYGGRGKPDGYIASVEDRDMPTPYNTYTIDGLPPGPISNPGRAALEAVANPSRNRDLFFVADGTGGHAFAETYEEHLRNVASWRAIKAERQSAASEGVVKAILYEEPVDGVAPDATVTAVDSTVTWRFVSDGPNGPQVEANLSVPERNMTITLSIHRNTDETLPASHLAQVVVHEPANFTGMSIGSIPRIVLKPTESARGQALVGAAAKVADGIFWIALSAAKNDIAGNLSLIRDRNWIDLPFVYNNGQRAILTFEKGSTGEAAFQQALVAWGAGSDQGSAPSVAGSVTIFPKNVSSDSNSIGNGLGLGGDGERFIAIEKGQSFRELLAANNVSEDDAESIVTALAQLVDLNAIHVGQKVRLAYASDGTKDGTLTPLRVSIYDEGTHQATVARTDHGLFIRADEPTLATSELAPTSRGSKAILYEEPVDGASPDATVTAVNATVTWRYVNDGPNGPQVEASLDVPDRDMTITFSLHKNGDESLPASHLVEVVVDIPADFPGKSIGSIPRIVLKPTESARGQPLAGAAAKVADGFFWIALSAADNDLASNLSLMRKRNWIDLPFVYENGQRAIITFEKGAEGKAAFEQAFVAWDMGSPDGFGSTNNKTAATTPENKGKASTIDKWTAWCANRDSEACRSRKVPEEPTAMGSPIPSTRPPAASSSVAVVNATRRVALVIGNSDYEMVAALDNPRNDALAIAQSLRAIGFDEVDVVENLGQRQLLRTLRDFSSRASGAATAVIYYAGHGVEVDGRNYLVPTDAELARASDVEFEAIPLENLRTAVAGASKLRLIILDACRNNPFRLASADNGRNIGRGLARVESRSNEIIAYAAKEGTIARDGSGELNSPFAAALIRYLAEPGLEVDFLFRRVRDDVLAATYDQQEPVIYASLGGEPIYLNPPAEASAAVPTVDPASVGQVEAANDFQIAREIGTTAAWDAFLSKHGGLAANFHVQMARAAREKLAAGALREAPTANPEEPLTSPANDWKIQIASTPTQAAALSILSRARIAGSDLLGKANAYVEPVQKGSETLYRVRFSGFSGQAEAQTVCAHLVKAKFACYAIAD